MAVVPLHSMRMVEEEEDVVDMKEVWRHQEVLENIANLDKVPLKEEEVAMGILEIRNNFLLLLLADWVGVIEDSMVAVLVAAVLKDSPGRSKVVVVVVVGVEEMVGRLDTWCSLKG